MRPARKGPENLLEWMKEVKSNRASMRPARKGPENPTSASSSLPPPMRFNEAGPQGAGKPSGCTRGGSETRGRFNEAGPQGAGKPRGESTSMMSVRGGFNEAGPQGAGKPRSRVGRRSGIITLQ